MYNKNSIKPKCFYPKLKESPILDLLHIILQVKKGQDAILNSVKNERANFGLFATL